MFKVFLSGSMRIKNFDKNVIDRLENIINSNYEILVGDADGVDSSMQEFLHLKNYQDVRVYCAGSQPRNNIGSWEVNYIQTLEKPGTRAFFTAKDLEMAKECDYGFMVWDTKSTGTLSNAIELLSEKKYSLVYVNKEKEFIKVKSIDDLEKLLSFMSPTSYEKADKKIRLREKVDSFKHEQSNLF